MQAEASQSRVKQNNYILCLNTLINKLQNEICLFPQLCHGADSYLCSTVIARSSYTVLLPTMGKTGCLCVFDFFLPKRSALQLSLLNFISSSDQILQFIKIILNSNSVLQGACNPSQCGVVYNFYKPTLHHPSC